MANGQDKAKETVGAFIAWKALVPDEELFEMIWRGEIKKSGLAKIIDCSTSAFRQNPALKAEYEQFMDELRDRGVLPPLSEEAKGSRDAPREYDQSARKGAQASKRVGALEQENIELKAKVEKLEAEVERLKGDRKRYGELSEAMADYGVFLS